MEGEIVDEINTDITSGVLASEDGGAGTGSVKTRLQALKKLSKSSKAGGLKILDRENPELGGKVRRYLSVVGIPMEERMNIHRACRDLEEKLGVESIKPREYVYLNKIRTALVQGAKPDYVQLAIMSGYRLGQARNPEVEILAKIDPRVMSELLGFSKADIEREMVKVMKQDDDLPAKMRALELAGKMIGLIGEEKGVSVTVNTGVKLGD